MSQKLITIAIQELGVAEIIGQKHNERIMQYAEEAGFPEYTEDEIAWCSLFMNWVAVKGSMEKTDKLTARSWLNVGSNVDDSPEPGDVVIYWREDPTSWKGHVGIFIGYSKDGTRIYTLGGNQNHMVSISAYRANRLLGFRRLASVEPLELPEVGLERGSRGKEVVKLQDALKAAGFQPGTSDGDFGPKTEAALRAFQATFATSDEEMTGVFDEKTLKELSELLKEKMA